MVACSPEPPVRRNVRAYIVGLEREMEWRLVYDVSPSESCRAIGKYAWTRGEAVTSAHQVRELQIGKTVMGSLW
jgi:hypothetical protein